MEKELFLKKGTEKVAFPPHHSITFLSGLHKIKQIITLHNFT